VHACALVCGSFCLSCKYAWSMASARPPGMSTGARVVAAYGSMIRTTGLNNFSSRVCAITEMGFASSNGHSGIVYSLVPLAMILAGNWAALCAQTSGVSCLHGDTGDAEFVAMRVHPRRDICFAIAPISQEFVLAASAFQQASGNGSSTSAYRLFDSTMSNVPPDDVQRASAPASVRAF